MSQCYEIRVRGHLSAAFAAALGDPDAAPAPAQTIVRRDVADSAELHEFLRRCQALGLELVEVHRLPDGGGASPPGPRRVSA